MLPTEIWQKELNRIYTRRLEFMALMQTPPAAPLPWYRRQWNRLRYRISELRERLGEIVAGRRFEDY